MTPQPGTPPAPASPTWWSTSNKPSRGSDPLRVRVAPGEDFGLPCLMPNDVHLLVETPGANLGIGMQWLHGLYAQTFNERHGPGHLFQGRYGSVRVATDAQLWVLVRYLAVNPVRAELCGVRPTGAGAATAHSPGQATPAGWIIRGCCSTSERPAVIRAERYSAMVADDYLNGGSESAARVRHTGE